jgi:6-pyruvoyltetrahydropterin/6-carboxytetrahydropterin synthase
MISICRRLEIDAGHRIYGHEGKCAFLHGHRWTIEVTVTAPELDRIGRVIDFGVIKQRIGGWLDDRWDHGFILCCDDKEGISAVAKVNGPEKTYVLDRNPTSENLARHLLEDIFPTLLDGTDIQLVSVTVHETPNCKATATK